MPRIADLMKDQAICLSPEATLADAGNAMLATRASSVIVLSAGRVTGIVTEGDLLHAMRQRCPQATTLSAAMTSPVHTVLAEEDFREAYRKAARLGIRHLVVLADDGLPLGVVSESDFRRYLGLDFFRRLNNVDALMERHFPRLPPSASLEEAMTAMEAVRVSCVVVVDGGRAQGIVTERDIVRLFLDSQGNPSLAEVMTSPVHSVHPDTPLAAAVDAMLKAGIRHLAVIDDAERLVGVLTEHSLMRPLEFDLLDDALAERSKMALELSTDEQIIANNARYQRALLDNFPFPVWLKDTESRFLAVNRPFLQAAGKTSVHDFLAKSDRDVWPLDLAEQYMADDREVMNSGQTKYVVEPILDHGVRTWFETYKAPVRTEDGALLGTVGFARDISASRRSDEAMLARNAAMAGLLRGDRIEGVLELIALSLEAEMPGRVCSILVVNEQKHALALGAAPSLPEAACAFLDGMPIAEGAGSSGCAAFRRERVVLRDVFTECQSERAHQFARLAGVISGWSEPIFSPAGDLLGTFSAYSPEQILPSEEEQNLLTQASQLAALILAQQRNAQRLQESVETFRGIFDGIRAGLLVLDAEGYFLDLNHEAVSLGGVAREEMIGASFERFSAPGRNDLAQIKNRIALAAAGKPQIFEFWVINGLGRVFPLEVHLYASVYFGRQVLIASVQDISERQASERRLRLAASVFDNAHEGIMITDAEGRIIEVNGTFSELTGFERSEAVGQGADLLRSGHHDSGFYREMWATIRASGYWQGEVWNRKKSGELFAEMLTISTVRNDTGEITHFVGIFSDITLLKEHQQRLEHLAHFDALTQLPNRMLLSDRLQLAMAQTGRSGRILAVCYLDLDGFKPVNDTYGHAAGDRLLVEVGHRLRQCVRAGDTVARLGGDEFVLLFSTLDDLHECDRAVLRVLSTLSTPFMINDEEVRISASIGVTLYPIDGADADTLLRHADQAMYQAKQAGRNRFHLFDPESDRLARVRRDEISRIREGFVRREFALYYQPKVNMREGRVVGAEALIRWHHPEQGLLLPISFLPAIEGSDFDAALGDWVIEEALRQLDEWQAAGLDIAVSVNISGKHLQSPHFAARLGELLAQHPTVPPSRLELEILETAALEDIARVADVFVACRHLGVSFALDDFGTGYSSLTYFRRLPADTLKIDQSFVRDMLDDPDDLSIVEGVIGLTKAFKRKVIAEGVETAEHGMVLLQLGCDLAQGYGIARPMPAADLPAWVGRFVPNELWSAIAAFQWSRDDLSMLVAEIDHQRWVRSLEVYVADRRGVAALPDMGHEDCRFGRWYHGVGAEKYGKLESFAAIDGLHRAVHLLAEKLVEERDMLEPAARAQRIQALHEASVRLGEQIELMQAEVLFAAAN